MAAFVKSITLPKSGKEGVLKAAYPDSKNSRVINVICGQNNCGKTYILRRLRTALENFHDHNYDSSPDISIEMTEDVNSPLNILYFGKSWQDKEHVGKVCR